MDKTVTKQNYAPTLIGLLKLMRPKQWVKNTFVLAPLLFSGSFTSSTAVSNALFAMLLFCLASSAGYIINDYNDIEQDLRHPIKSKKRPMASGQVSKRQALSLLCLLYGGLLWGFVQMPTVFLIILAYLMINLTYTFILKHQPVIDIFTIAIGFVLRIYAGATALSVEVSSYMFITTLCLALYLAAIKRRQELIHSGKEGRKVLQHYSVSLVERYAEMSATGALIFYSQFVMTTRPELVITIPLVLYGLFRYWYIAEALDEGESPTDILTSDWQMSLTVLIWVFTSTWSLWPKGI